MTWDGGVRDRLIGQSLYELVLSTLTQRGWLTPNANRRDIVPTPTPIDAWREVQLNTLAVFLDSIDGEEAELGSNASNDSHLGVIDFFAESEAVGVQLIGDLRASLEGRLPVIGRTAAILPVYDWRDATPPLLFYCDIEDVKRDRSPESRDPWRQFWMTLTFALVDEAA